MAMRHLQEQAAEDRLRFMAVSELRLLLQAAQPTDEAKSEST